MLGIESRKHSNIPNTCRERNQTVSILIAMKSVRVPYIGNFCLKDPRVKNVNKRERDWQILTSALQRVHLLHVACLDLELNV